MNDRRQVMYGRPNWCEEPAALLAFGDDCAARGCRFEECKGHQVCERHGAELRRSLLPERPSLGADSEPYRLARICTLSSAPSVPVSVRGDN